MIKLIAMKSIQRIILFSALLVFFILSAMSQPPGDHEKRMEKYRSMKIAYFTDNLDFTPEEAEKFWPLYNKYEKDERELRRMHHTMVEEFSEQPDELSVQEVQKILDRHILIMEQEMQLEIKFYNELQEVLPAKKVMKFYITENEFRRYMLRRIREERGKGNRKGEGPIP